MSKAFDSFRIDTSIASRTGSYALANEALDERKENSRRSRRKENEAPAPRTRARPKRTGQFQTGAAKIQARFRQWSALFTGRCRIADGVVVDVSIHLRPNLQLSFGAPHTSVTSELIQYVTPVRVSRCAVQTGVEMIDEFASCAFSAGGKLRFLR